MKDPNNRTRVTPGVVGLACFILFICVVSPPLGAAPFRIVPVDPPRPAPAFELPDPNGKVVRLGDLKGKVVIVNFWASWCSPCIAEMPSLQKLHEEMQEKGLVVVGISVDSRKKDAVKIIERFGLSFTLLLDPKGESARAYRSSALPSTFVINREGRIVASYRGPAAWDSPAAIDYFETLLGGKNSSTGSEKAQDRTLKGIDTAIAGPQKPVPRGKSFSVRIDLTWKSAQKYDFEPPRLEIPPGITLTQIEATAKGDADKQKLTYVLHFSVGKEVKDSTLRLGPFKHYYESTEDKGFIVSDAVDISLRS